MEVYMDIILLNECDKDVKDLFNRFIPKDYLGLLEEETTILLGAIDTNEDGIEPIGITIVSIDDGYFVIKWMWIDPELRLQGAGEKMLKTCFDIALMNELNTIYAYVPALDTEDISESDMAEFFYNNTFNYVENREKEGVKYYVLSANTDIYTNMDNEMMNETVNQSRIDKAYSKFPNNFVEREVEYYSGVKIEE